jgi:hypothetical protein
VIAPVVCANAVAAAKNTIAGPMHSLHLSAINPGADATYVTDQLVRRAGRN